MSDENIPDWLRDEIAGDYYPWRRLADFGSAEVASIRFPEESEAELQELANEARAAGMEVEIGRLAMLSADTPGLLMITISVVKGALTVYGVLKMINDGPAQVKQLLGKFRALKHNKDLHPLLCLDPVNTWLDTKYGVRRWRYDPDAVLVKHRAPGGLNLGFA